MSHPKNTEWIEAAQENFDEALAAGDAVGCENIIADSRDVGFTHEAQLMEEALKRNNV